MVAVSLSTTRVYGGGEVTVALSEIEWSSLVLQRATRIILKRPGMLSR